MYKAVIADLQKLSDPVKKEFLPRFFKTGPGEYSEGDVFIAVTVPQTRTVVKRYVDLSLQDVQILLKNPIHECRLAALLILVEQFKKADAKGRKNIVNLYLKNTKYINNWDLVDSSADKILGAWLDEIGDTTLLDTLAASKSLWEQRIAIVATFHFIRKKSFHDTFRIADHLINHKHDLIHKAVGWMLREVGKRADEKALVTYLQTRYKTMPRTMLRYAIERFDERTRKKYLKGTI